MKSIELTEELEDLFDDDFIYIIYGVIGGISIMVIYITIQLVMVMF